MAAENVPLIAFNRGLVSALALARVDLKRTALSAQVYRNWMARVLGSMMLRPGMGYLGNSRSNLRAFHIPFVFNLQQKAVLELTDQALRVWISDALLTRVAVASAVANGNFAADVASWTDADEAGATSIWSASFGGSLSLAGTGTNAAIRRQQVAVAAPDQNVEHALRIVIEQGPVTLRVGSASGLDDYISQTVLDTGTHSLALTPTGASIWIDFLTRRIPPAYVGSCNVEAAGVVEIPTPWLEADLRSIRYDTSGDITYVASASTTVTVGYQQRAIERRAARSWSVVLYAPEDGPFRVENVLPITITPSALTGSITLTASVPIFKSTHVGALFRVTSVGQTVTKAGVALNDATAPIRVTGVGTDRALMIVISGFFDGVRTIILERSFDQASWTAVPTGTWIAAVTAPFTDGLDNQIVYYRLRISVLGGAGQTDMQLSIGTGSITGIARVRVFTTNVLVTADVLTDMGATTASEFWSEGSWSDIRGYPTSVVFDDGRLWWFGKSFEWGSVSDGFYSFDDQVEGDSAPITRSIGSGPVDNINWALSLRRLFMGGELSEMQTVSSSLDEPLTPTNNQIRSSSTQGSAAVQALKLDSAGIFVRQGGTRLYELAMSSQDGDFSAKDLSAIMPDIFDDPNDPTLDKSIVRIAIQRKPDTRIHCIRADGVVGVLIFDRVEEVTCWLEVETDGDVEDIVILPGSREDQVYYSVKRTINAATVRFLERWALESEARGGLLNKQADAFVVHDGAPATNLAAAHLEGKQVVVWADGVDVGHDENDALIHTVTAGILAPALSAAASKIVVGLPYNGDWKSAKLAYAAQLGTALNQKKKVGHLGVILKDTHARGLKYGPDFDTLDPLPEMESGALVDPDSIWSEYDKASFEFPGNWDTDSRICLRAMAPRPCTLLALTATVETNEKQ